MRRIQEDFKLKDDKIAEPDVNLGATIAKMSIDNGRTCWTKLPEQYVRVAVTNVEEDLQEAAIQVCDTFLLQLCSMAGRYARAESRQGATLPGTHWPTSVGS
jgi:hypothetical protein